MKRSKVLLIILVASLALFLIGCQGSNKSEGGKDLNLDQFKKPEVGEEIAVISTNYGDISIRLFPDVAPKAVENFKTHAQNGYYDGVTFHRVIKDFMIQGGDPDGTGAGGESIWGAPFEDEFHQEYHNFTGALSMANAGPNTNGSQFFIVQSQPIEEDMLQYLKAIGEIGDLPEEVVNAYKEVGGAPWLDFKHTVFGQVVEGMDIVEAIANVETGANDKPIEPVVMEKVEIVEYK